ncbi:conserved hypothetical secreted protein [Mycobacterium marinum M]|uniref:Conserved hypothetical secreted protein n=1 Tax=Mycobacterium marinum (strain ATCC BAA-535 / M) TaxID=216594 RepID=B2HRV4_MYCMM|nr:DUF5134 domain-containing protein [Mycobacterium marinum]ACC40984.1 conserved hypothetical secreted protein [Mycobacterium marinum M]
MIHNLLLRWFVTGLFAVTAVECVLPIIVQRRPSTLVVSHSLHFLMAVGMAAMAWPWGTRLPSAGPAVLFMLATLWFATMAVIAARTPAGRVVYGYHGLMMLAMAWMYVSMNIHLVTGGASAMPDNVMPGMDMAGMNGWAHRGSPVWVSTINWLAAITFAAAAVFWTCRYAIELRHALARFRSMGSLGQAVIAAGMSILFFAALFEI